MPPVSFKPLDVQKALPPPKSHEPPKKPPPASKKPSEKVKKSNKSSGSSSIFSRLVPSFLLPPNQVHLPDESDASIVWDEDKKRWVDKNSGGEDEDSMPNSAPPSDMDLSR